MGHSKSSTPTKDRVNDCGVLKNITSALNWSWPRHSTPSAFITRSNPKNWSRHVKAVLVISKEAFRSLSVSSTWYQALGTKCLVPITWCQLLGARYLVPNTLYQVLVLGTIWYPYRALVNSLLLITILFLLIIVVFDIGYWIFCAKWMFCATLV